MSAVGIFKTTALHAMYLGSLFMDCKDVTMTVCDTNTDADTVNELYDLILLYLYVSTSSYRMCLHIRSNLS